MKDVLPEMAYELLMQCELIFEILKCTLPEDTIDVDLKTYTLRRTKKIEVCKSSNVAPWGTEVQP